MPLRNREYGKPEDCEVPDCEQVRGAPLRSEYHYGCVLCAKHETDYQKGRISLPESATQARKRSAEDEILG